MSNCVDIKKEVIEPIVALIRKHKLSMSAAESILNVVKEQLAKVPLSSED